MWLYDTWIYTICIYTKCVYTVCVCACACVRACMCVCVCVSIYIWYIDMRKMDIPGMVEGYTVYGYMDIRHTDKKMDVFLRFNS